MSRIVVLLLAVAALCAVDARRVRVDGNVPWKDIAGYTPVVLTITSPVMAEAVMHIDRRGDHAEDAWTVPAGVSRRTILLPPEGQSQWVHSARVRWTIGKESGTESVSIDRHSSIGIYYVHTGYQGFDQVQELVNHASRHGRHDDAGQLAPADLPDRWQAYPLWLRLVLTPEALEQLSAAQAEAIATWIRSGGMAMVTADGSARALAGHGIAQLPVLPIDPARQVDHSHARRLKLDDGARHHDPTDTHVPGTESVPVIGFVVLVLVFAGLVGPANIWWSIRSGRRWQVYVVTPVVSFGICLLLVLYNLFSEGVSIRRMADQFVMLDQQRHRAMAWTGVTYFAPLGISTMAVDADTKVVPMNNEDHEHRHWRQRNDFDGNLSIDWRTSAGGQQATGDWVPARLNRRLVYVQDKPFRGRLRLTRDGDGYRLANEFEVALTGFSWRDGKGGIWNCSTVAPGGEADLRRVNGRGKGPVSGFNGPDRNLGAAALHLWRNRHDDDQVAVAQLAGPLLPVPGPDGIDAETRSWVMVELPVEGEPR